MDEGRRGTISGVLLRGTKEGRSGAAGRFALEAGLDHPAHQVRVAKRCTCSSKEEGGRHTPVLPGGTGQQFYFQDADVDGQLRAACGTEDGDGRGTT